MMIERAVRVNPRMPASTGLRKVIEHSLDEGGGVATRKFTPHVAQLAEVDAHIMKQSLLLSEEPSNQEKDDSKSPSDAQGGKPKAKTKKEGKPPET